MYWATGVETASGTLGVTSIGRQQSGGYANEAFHDVPNDRWVVFSWLGAGLHGGVDCANDVGITMPGCWWGAQSLPRLVSLQPDGRSVKFPVVPEMEKLLVGSGTRCDQTLRMAGKDEGGLALDDAGLVGPQSRVRVSASIVGRENDWSGAFGVDLLPRRKDGGGPCATADWDAGLCLVTRVSVSRQLGSGQTYGGGGGGGGEQHHGFVNTSGRFSGNAPSPVTLLKLQAIHAHGGQEPGVSLEIPHTFNNYTFDIWIDRSVVEVYGDGGAQVLVMKTGITAEPEPRAPYVWATGSVNATHEVTLRVIVHPVKSAVFTSDPGPWNPS